MTISYLRLTTQLATGFPKVAPFSLTFDNSCVGHDPSTIDVEPASAAANAQRAADVPHPAPAVPATRRPRRNSRESRCLPGRKTRSFQGGREETPRLNRGNYSDVGKAEKTSRTIFAGRDAFHANITKYH